MSSGRPQTLNNFFVKLPKAKSFTEVTFNKMPSESLSSIKFYQCTFQNYQEAKDFLTWADTLRLDFVFTRSLKNISTTQSVINITLTETIYNALLPKIEELVQNELDNDGKKKGRVKSLKSAVKALGMSIKQKVSTLFTKNNTEDCDDSDISDDDDALEKFMDKFHTAREQAKKLNMPHDSKSIITLITGEEEAALSRARKEAQANKERYAIALAESETAFTQQIEKAKQLSIEEAIKNNKNPQSPDELKRDAYNRIVYPPKKEDSTETSNSNDISALSSTRMSTPSL